MNQKFRGELEIREDGVIYFHDAATGTTKLRISQLPTPVKDVRKVGLSLDITHLFGTDWDRNTDPVKQASELMFRVRALLGQALTDHIPGTSYGAMADLLDCLEKCMDFATTIESEAELPAIEFEGEEK